MEAIPMPVNWEDLQLAVEFVGSNGFSEHYAFLCKESGKIYWQSEGSDDLDELPDDIDDNEKYIQIPGKRELNLGTRLVFDFVRQFLPGDFDEVQRIFSRKGAYARFKNLLARRRAVDRWYEFEAKTQETALLEWWKDNAIELAPRQATVSES
jgi:hypothetical protein